MGIQINPTESSTITYTVPSPITSEPVITSILERDHDVFECYQATIDRLLDIIEEYRESEDTLSGSLYKKGLSLAQKAYDEYPSTFVATQILIAKIEKLKEVLRNPFGESMLVDPWIVGDLVWEKFDLDRYQRCLNTVYSHAGRPVPQIESAPHAFSKEMITWMNSLNLLTAPSFSASSAPSSSSSMPVEIPVNENNLSGVIVLSQEVNSHQFSRDIVEYISDDDLQNPRIAYIELQKYHVLIASVEKERQQMAERKKSKMHLRQQLVDIQQAQQETQNKIEQVEKFCATSTTQIRELSERTRNEYMSTMQVSIAKIESLETEVEKEKQELAELKVKADKQEAQIRSLGHQLVERGHEIQRARNSRSGGYSCTIM